MIKEHREIPLHSPQRDALSSRVAASTEPHRLDFTLWGSGVEGVNWGKFHSVTLSSYLTIFPFRECAGHITDGLEATMS